MKILIAYDGSDCARASIADLVLAGLPESAEVRVLSVAEVQPALATSTLDPGYGASYVSAELMLEDVQALTEATQREASATAEEGVLQVRGLFPGWSVQAVTRSDPPAASILDEASEWKADLLVVGSHGRSAVARVFYGSVSQKVAKYAHCSVRVGRGSPVGALRPPGPGRMLLAFDASSEAYGVVEAVAARQWPAGTQLRLLTVLDLRLALAFPARKADDSVKSLQDAAKATSQRLHDVGLDAVYLAKRGDPKRLILSEAEDWRADCIFIGTHGLGAGRRFLLGTAASAVVSRAHCSVELIRSAVPAM